MSLEIQQPLQQPLGKSFKVKKFVYCLGVGFVTGKYAYIFRVARGGRIFCRKYFQGESFPWRRRFPGGELFRGNFILGEFSILPLQDFFICLAFSFPLNFKRGDDTGNCPC